MSLRLERRVLRLALRDPFHIARESHGAGREITTVVVEIRDDAESGGRSNQREEGVGRVGRVGGGDGAAPFGLGEGYPDAYYGETPETIDAVLPLLVSAVEPLTEQLRGSLVEARAALAEASAAMDGAIRHHGAAKCAVDIALHDLVARRLGIAVHELLGTSSDVPPTDFTIGIDEPSIVAERAARASRFPALKIKVGGRADLETLEAVRRVYPGRIRVDANTGWEPEAGVRLVPELVRLGVELIEQPFPAHRLDQMRWLQERSELPVVADESAVTIDDLDMLIGVCAGVNVKLAKCGGVGPAKRMLDRAGELGFRRFLGCMEETSITIAASASVASLAEWVDLDGNLLLADDPFTGIELDSACRWRLGTPGLGVVGRARMPVARVPFGCP